VGSPTSARAGLDPCLFQILQQSGDADTAHFLVIGKREMQRPPSSWPLPISAQRQRHPDKAFHVASAAAEQFSVAHFGFEGSLDQSCPSTGTTSVWPTAQCRIAFRPEAGKEIGFLAGGIGVRRQRPPAFSSRSRAKPISSSSSRGWWCRSRERLDQVRARLIANLAVSRDVGLPITAREFAPRHVIVAERSQHGGGHHGDAGLCTQRGRVVSEKIDHRPVAHCIQRVLEPKRGDGEWAAYHLP